MTLLVGCPFRDRSWALPGWFKALDEALGVAETTAMVVFAHPLGDNEGLEEIAKGVSNSTNISDYQTICVIEDKDIGPRDWSWERLKYISDIRNRLLRLVREISPDLFWSLDSDIQTSPESLKNALPLIGEYDAVGMNVNMDHLGLPSYGNLSQGGLYREPRQGSFEVDVIMASKLMTKPAYNVDYSPEILGEDVGWSKACRSAGLRLGWDSSVPSLHILERSGNSVASEAP